MRLNKNLVDLLRDLEERVDEADKKVINQTLHDVGTFPSLSFLSPAIESLLTLTFCR
jgi:hypothetical protein